MRIFAVSINNNNPIPDDVNPPSAITDFSVIQLGTDEVGNLTPVTAFPSSGASYRSLNANEVRVLFLFGHSDMAGNGQNYYQFDNTLCANDWATSAEVAENPDCLIWTGSSWAVMHHSAFSGDTQNVPSGGTGKHGRELQFKHYYKDYFDATHTEKLHVHKHTAVYLYSFAEFMYGTPDFNDLIANQVHPVLQNLIDAGKTPVPHFIFDCTSDYPLMRATNGLNNFVFKGIQYSLQKAFNIDAMNIMVTLRNYNPMQVNPYVHQYTYFNQSMLLACNQLPNIISYGSKEGSCKVSAGDEHGGYNTFKDVAHGFTRDFDDGNGNITSVTRKGQLQSIADAPVIPISNNVIDVSDSTIIYFNKKYYDYPDTTILKLTLDVPFSAEVFTNEIKGRVDNVTYLEADIGSYEIGFIVIENDLTGVQRFEFGNQGFYIENHFIEKYKATLNYIDIRGNMLGLPPDAQGGDVNKLLAILVSGGVTNGTLLLEGTQYDLTVAAQSDYDILITRGWTIDVARP